MRPHRLRLRAFGPFGGEEVVDLDRLADAGLFLLSGPTGAGKTTVLDALCFALYGQVPGSRSAKGLRSQHAPADAPTEVELEATVGGSRLRITRRPEQERPKARGTGLTTDQASVLLQEHRDGRWEVLSARPAEADQAVADRLGLSAAQFFQVVLLPQGQFQEFLLAPAKQREDLLATLFDVDRYERAAGWLGGAKKDAAAALEEARRDVDEQATRAAEAAGADVPIDVDGPWLAEVVEAAAGRAGGSRAAADEAVAAAGRERARLDEARALADRQRRRRERLADLARLDREAPQVEAAATELDAARRAERVRALLEAADEAAQAESDAAGASESARRLLDAARGEQAAPADVAGLRALAGRLRGRAEALQALVEVEQGLAARRDDLERRRDAERSSRQVVAATTEQLAALPERRRQAQERRDVAVRAADGLAAVTERVQALQARVDAVDRLTPLQSRLDEAVQEVRQAVETRAAAERHRLEVQEARFEGMRAELADLLAEDPECPVCGSLEHPNPAAFVGRRVSDADQRAAEQAGGRAAEAERAAAAELAGLQAEQARLRGVAGLDADDDDRAADAGADTRGRAGAGVDDVRAALDVARRDAEQARGRAADVDAARAALDALATQEAALTSRRDAALLEAEQAAAGATALAEQLDRDERRVGEARGPAAALAEVVVGLRRRADRADDLAMARERHDAAASARQRADSRLADAVAEAGLADVDQVRAALRGPSRQEELEREVTGHREARSAVQEALASDDLAVALEPAVDVDGVAERCAVAEDAARTASADARAAAGRHARLLELQAALAAALERARPVQERFERVAGLADLTSGGGRENARRMSLRSYVLAARLEQVVEAATDRLAAMSAGRYTLQHTDRRAGRGALSGLGLDVLDAHTGRPRPVSDLSGGEKFMASLALALGLADVVRAEAGGVRLDALFVDEGFGSLDEDSLDLVMTTLDELRAGGRLVGLVSHVTEMKQRITAAVAVASSPRGSSLALVGV